MASGNSKFSAYRSPDFIIRKKFSAIVLLEAVSSARHTLYVVLPSTYGKVCC